MRHTDHSEMKVVCKWKFHEWKIGAKQTETENYSYSVFKQSVNEARYETRIVASRNEIPRRVK